MSIIWVAVGVALVIVWGITVFDIIRRHLGAKRTSAWLLIVVLLPFVGALGYWVLRKPEPGDAAGAAAVERDRREQAQRRSFDSTGFGS
jgi:Phospholipase_D-nuclease N-terminal